MLRGLRSCCGKRGRAAAAPPAIAQEAAGTAVVATMEEDEDREEERCVSVERRGAPAPCMPSELGRTTSSKLLPSNVDTDTENCLRLPRGCSTPAVASGLELGEREPAAKGPEDRVLPRGLREACGEAEAWPWPWPGARGDGSLEVDAGRESS